MVAPTNAAREDSPLPTRSRRSYPYQFRRWWLRERWTCEAWRCSCSDKPPTHSESRRGRSAASPSYSRHWLRLHKSGRYRSEADMTKIYEYGRCNGNVLLWLSRLYDAFAPDTGERTLTANPSTGRNLWKCRQRAENVPFSQLTLWAVRLFFAAFQTT
jgi:hypothetical protein